MKHKLLYLLLFVLLNSVAQPAEAGFFVKKLSAATALRTASEGNVAVTTKVEKLNQSVKDIAPPPFRNWEYKGWVGIVAMLLGILGFIYPLFSIGAILFGFIGVGRKNRNRGLAVAGLILGLTVLFLSIFFGFTPWGIS